jgi:hypothetical protein
MTVPGVVADEGECERLMRMRFHREYQKPWMMMKSMKMRKTRCYDRRRVLKVGQWAQLAAQRRRRQWKRNWKGRVGTWSGVGPLKNCKECDVVARGAGECGCGVGEVVGCDDIDDDDGVRRLD